MIDTRRFFRVCHQFRARPWRLALMPAGGPPKADCRRRARSSGRRGLADRQAACCNDPLAPERVQHRLAEIIRLRVLMTNAGYQDGNDIDTLRSDPTIKLSLDRLLWRRQQRASAPSPGCPRPRTNRSVKDGPMRGGAILIAAALFCAAASTGGAQTVAERLPEAAWEQVDPAAAGWSADRLKDTEAWSQKIGTTALMVVHRGRVVAQWGDTAAKTPPASVRKSLVSALFGNAIERGGIDLKQTLAELGIDDNEPSLSAEEKTATVRDLLEARSGVYHAALYETPSMAARRPARASHPPGTFWYYNNWDFNTLGAIYERAARHLTWRPRSRARSIGENGRGKRGKKFALLSLLPGTRRNRPAKDRTAGHVNGFQM